MISARPNRLIDAFPQSRQNAGDLFDLIDVCDWHSICTPLSLGARLGAGVSFARLKRWAAAVV